MAPLPPPEEMELSPEVEHLLKLQEEIDQNKATALNQVKLEIERLQTWYRTRLNALHALLARLDPSAANLPIDQIPTPTPAMQREEGVYISAKFNPQKYCPVCQIPGHDGRAHRGQFPQSRAFSRKELE